KRLLTDVFGWHLLAMRVRDFEVVAKHRVETDFDVGNSGPLALGRLVLGHPLFAAGAELAEFIDVEAVAVANEVAFPGSKRTLVDEGLLQGTADVSTQVQPAFDFAEERAGADGEFGFHLR